VLHCRLGAGRSRPQKRACETLAQADALGYDTLETHPQPGWRLCWARKEVIGVDKTAKCKTGKPKKVANAKTAPKAKSKCKK
jgi:hypothetical protein